MRVEATEVNHLLDASLDEVWWQMYGEEAKARTDALLGNLVKQERDSLRAAFSSLWEGVANYFKEEISSHDLASIMGETRSWL